MYLVKRVTSNISLLASGVAIANLSWWLEPASKMSFSHVIILVLRIKVNQTPNVITIHNKVWNIYIFKCCLYERENVRLVRAEQIKLGK